MFERIKSKIERERIKRFSKNVPLQKQATFGDEGSGRWYEPLLAGPSSFVNDCNSQQTRTEVLDVLKKLTPEKYLEFIAKYYRQGMDTFGAKWRYADILTVLCGICKNIKVENYMEIGVRRGRSMAIVASLNPAVQIYGFDMWIPGYVGIDNPGADFVKSELQKIGYTGNPIFINGDSKKTVPKFFRENSGIFFDLITVDGDHSASGAAADLRNVIPRLKIGGALVFDDICNVYHPTLKHVWDKVVVKSKRFMTYTFDELGFGVSFAIKKY